MSVTRRHEAAATPRWLLLVLGACASSGVTTGCVASANDAETSAFSSQALSAADHDDVLRVTIPKNLGVADLRQPTAETRRRLDEALRDRLNGSVELHGDVFVLVDVNGRKILPDLETAQQRSATLAASTNELSFTFDSPDSPWSPDELTTVQEWVRSCYEEIRLIYGPPAFSNVVNVRKSPASGSAGAYSPSTNEIFMTNINGAVACHEIVHAFHDDLVIGMSSWEEGMARAVEVEACKHAGIPSSNAHDYYYDVAYEELNQPIVGAKAGSLFAGWSQVLLRYQLAGYAWAKPMLEDAEFFRNFNSSLYLLGATDPSVTRNESELLRLASEAKSSVENTPFATWYPKQHVLNTEPPTGDLIYLRVTDVYGLYVFLLNRQPSGAETNLAGIQVEWSVTDHSGKVLATGSGMTSAYGWIEIRDPALNVYWTDGYEGRFKIAAEAVVGDTPLQSSAYITSFPGQGVFGVVVGADTGSIAFTPLDSSSPPVSVAVSNGSFHAEDLLTVKGRIQYVFTTADGVSTQPVAFTKDDTPYFVHVEFSATPQCDKPHGCCKPHHHHHHHGHPRRGNTGRDAR